MNASYRSLLASALIPTVIFVAGCDDNKKASEQSAVDALGKLAPVVKEDVMQVRRGLPEGAQKLSQKLDADTIASPVGVQKAIAATRALVHDLEVAKGTFFSYADATGNVLRSEADPDVLAGKSILVPFPALKKALEGNAGVVETWGEMKDLRGVKNGPDIIWAAATPVKDDKGAVKGMFVTGWSLRAFAYHLETTVKMSVKEASDKAGKKNPPLVYVYVVKGKTAYGAPLAPDVNAQALEQLDVLGKTAAGPYRGAIEITNRAFGVAAQRTPELGDDTALAVIASEI